MQELRERLSRALGQQPAVTAVNPAVMQNVQPAAPAAVPVQTYTPHQPQPPQTAAPSGPPQYYHQVRDTLEMRREFSALYSNTSLLNVYFCKKTDLVNKITLFLV